MIRINIFFLLASMLIYSSINAATFFIIVLSTFSNELYEKVSFPFLHPGNNFSGDFF